MSDTCASCGKPIFWIVTPNKAKMPVDATPTLDGNVIVDTAWSTGVVLPRDAPRGDSPRYTSHFATCAQAAYHRRIKR